MPDCGPVASSPPVWTALLSALLTPAITILGAYIAWQQWRTNRNKLKLDLFERRFAVYDAARSLIRDVLTQTNPSDEQLLKFLANTGEARFLLSEGIATYLADELYKKAAELNRLWASMVELPAGEERARNQGSQTEIRSWFERQLPVLEAKFADFLRLKH